MRRYSRIIKIGENDLGSLFPDVAKEFHPTLKKVVCNAYRYNLLFSEDTILSSNMKQHTH